MPSDSRTSRCTRRRSEAVTNNVRVEVESQYAPEHSQPFQSEWFFHYTVRITNEGDETVQLLSRHWIITDADGAHRGSARARASSASSRCCAPGESFQYTSGCPLKTSTGVMRGTYQMVTEDGDHSTSRSRPSRSTSPTPSTNPPPLAPISVHRRRDRDETAVEMGVGGTPRRAARCCLRLHNWARERSDNRLRALESPANPSRDSRSRLVGAAKRTDRVEERVAEVGRLLRADAVHLVQILDRLRPPLAPCRAASCRGRSRTAARRARARGAGARRAARRTDSGSTSRVNAVARRRRGCASATTAASTSRYSAQSPSPRSSAAPAAVRRSTGYGSPSRASSPSPTSCSM